MTRTWQHNWLERFYRQRPGWVDGTTEFHRLIADNVILGGAILEVGAGPTNRTTEYVATLGAVTGLDIDPDAKTNVHLSASAVYDGNQFPFDNAVFDTVVSNFVLEHVRNPALHFQEIARVLRPGGRFVFRTPNLYHYVSAFAAITPHWVHDIFANRLRRLPDDHHPPYPTYHACNTLSTLQATTTAAGLTMKELRMIEKEPSYGMASRLLFLAFMGYERLVNTSEIFRQVRANILGVAIKR